MTIGTVVALAILVIALLYVSTYYKLPAEVSILHTSLNEFQFDFLREKQPIVFDDRVVAMDDIRQKWFSWNITKPFDLDGSDAWHANRYKFTVFHAKQEGDIYLYPAGKKMIKGDSGSEVPDPQENLLAIHMLPGQLCIVPFRWRYHIAAPMEVHALGVHDYVTYMLP